MTRKKAVQVDVASIKGENAVGIPTAFISYSWDDEAHKTWVRDFAARLRRDGVKTILDRWHAVPGDQLPKFMEAAIRENDFVLIVCTPQYKMKLEGRGGGVGYEGDIIQGEVLVQGNHRKFIPILRRGEWIEASPSVLAGKYRIDLREGAHYESNYQDLLRTLHNERERAPGIGPKPNFGPYPAIAETPDAPIAILSSTDEQNSRSSGSAGPGTVKATNLAHKDITIGTQTNIDHLTVQFPLPGHSAQRTLPTRVEEERYLARLIREIKTKAELYSPLHGSVRTQPAGKNANPLLSAWEGNPHLELLRHRSRRRERAAEEPGSQREYDDILTAFAAVHRAALLGAPGSGKSTTLRKLAVEVADSALKDPQAPLPLLVSLGNWTGDESLADFLVVAAPEIGWATNALSRAGRLVLLVDGLNEVPTATRAAKAAQVHKLKNDLHESTNIIVSCRSEDYVHELDLGLDTLSIEPLSPQRICAAVRQWVRSSGEAIKKADRFFWQLAGDERLAAVWEKWRSAGIGEDAFWNASDPKDHKKIYQTTTRQDDDLWRSHIRNPRSLVRLASNPFMLTMLFQVWVEDGEELPRNRGDLFRSFIQCLLSREGLVEESAGDRRLSQEGRCLLAGLADLAWRMQRERVGAGDRQSGDDFGVLTVVSRNAALEALGGETLLKKALNATLLEGTGELRFRHQLLQEYFTAQALEARLSKTDAEQLWPVERWWQRSGWEQTAVLLAGFQASDCTGVIRWLADAQPEVAAQCIVESGAELADRAGLLRELQVSWQARLSGAQREAQPEGRAAVGRALGRLSLDTRKGVGLTVEGLPDIDWVWIPGGEFIYQDGELRQVEGFHMARYPVTNAQYQAFLEAEDGYREDRWWKGLTDPDRQAEHAEWTESNHPRETVSWHEAMAFCRWLGEKSGAKVRLPTEWEWERAARGRDGRVWPWGNQYVAGYANISEPYGSAGPHSLGRTSAVGIYAEGASVEGVLDLIGNVWEWCLNENEKPKRMQAGDKQIRVLRGGSWQGHQINARAGFRHYRNPALRNYDFGFRVVGVVPSP